MNFFINIGTTIRKNGKNVILVSCFT